MIITFTNVIGAIRTAFSVVRSGLKMWLGFQTSETLGREEVLNGDFSDGTTSWIEGGNSTISVGTYEGKTDVANINITDALSNSRIEQAFDYVNGQTYQVSVEVYLVSGSFRADSRDGFVPVDFVSTTTTGSWQTLTGTITAIQTGTDVVWLRSDEQISQFYVNSISIKELTQITPDKSGNNNVGELFTGKAIELDGVNDEINFGPAQIPIKTISFWIKPLSVSNEGLFYLGLSGFPQFRQISITSGNISAASYLTNFTPYVNNIQTSAVTQDVWQRVVLTFDEWTTTSLQIGKVYSSVYGHFAISDVQFYNETWTTDDIAYDYANPNKLAIDNPSTSLVVTNLKAYWALSEGDGLVAYDSGTNLEEEEVQNGTFNLGSEEVDNGDGSSTVDWNSLFSNTTLSINNNKLRATSNNSSAYGLSQELNLNNGSTYQVVATINVDNASGGAGNLRIATNSTLNSGDTTLSASTGTITTSFVASANTMYIGIVDTADAAGNYVEIDSISVKEVPNWTLGDGWSVGDNNKITRTAQSITTSAAQDNISFVSGKSYSITYTLDVSAGSFLIRLGTPGVLDTPARSVSDTYTEVITATENHTKLNLRALGGTFAGSISNVSVREVTASDHGGLINGADYVDAQPRIPQLGMQNWSKGSNLFPFSEDFENSDWIKNAGTTITNNYATSPNGDLTAARYLGTGASGLYDTFTLSANSYTLSFYVKSNTSQTQLCRLVGDSNQVSSNLSVTTDWNRISYTFTASGLANKANGIYRDSNDNDLDILIWGAQLEQSSSAGAYRLTDGGATLNSTLIPNPTIPTKDIFGNLVRDRLNSFNLDGTGYAANETLPTISDNISLSVWVKLDTFVSGNLGQVVGKRLAGQSKWCRIYRPVEGALRLEVASGVFKGFFCPENEWVHIAATIDENNLSIIYINGVLNTQGSLTGGFAFLNTHPLGIGARLSPALEPNTILNGLVSDVLIYDRVLTSDEIENNYNAGLSAHTNN